MKGSSQNALIEKELLKAVELPQVENKQQAYDVVCDKLGKDKRPAIRRVKGELVTKLEKILGVLNTP